jgi:hypothetical protein
MKTEGTKTTLCSHCGSRPKREADPFDVAHEIALDYCDTCYSASRLANTSIDDARQSIQACTDVDELYMIAKFEFQRRDRRSTLLKLVNSRLGKLMQIRGFEVDPKIFGLK